MEHTIANRLADLKPSPTLAISAKANELKAQGEPVINLSVGEPDFPTPQIICDAAIEAINQGQTTYTAVDGTAELKQAIQNKLQRDNNLEYNNDQIIASCGAKHSLFNLFLALLNPDDEVVIPAPYWVSYPSMAIVAEAQSRIIQTSIDQDFKITPEQLEQTLNERTKIVIINSPTNPTGMSYSLEELQALGEVLKRYPYTYVISDDIYEKIRWSEQPFYNIASAVPELKERTFVVNGASKAYAMTGWRLGYAAGPKEVIAAAKKIQSQSTSNPCSISQAATAAALKSNESFLEPMINAFKERHDYLVDAVNQLPGFRAIKGEGAFYLFPNVEQAVHNLGLEDDFKLAEWLLDEAKIACVPGSAFGAPGYLRFSYATSMDNLKQAIERLQDVLKKS